MRSPRWHRDPVLRSRLNAFEGVYWIAAAIRASASTVGAGQSCPRSNTHSSHKTGCNMTGEDECYGGGGDEEEDENN